MKPAYKLTDQQGGIISFLWLKAPDSQCAVDSVSQSLEKAVVFLEANPACSVFFFFLHDSLCVYNPKHGVQTQRTATMGFVFFEGRQREQ